VKGAVQGNRPRNRWVYHVEYGELLIKYTGSADERLSFAGQARDASSRVTVSSSEVVSAMTTKAAAANVITLETHPTWRSAQRRSEELMAAMRRHPSYKGALPESRDRNTDAVVLRLAR
jgi:hypothetical protein